MALEDKVLVGIDRALYEKIKEFCDFNGLKRVKYVNDLLKDAFMRDKYGDKPFDVREKPENPDLEDELPEKIEEIEAEDETKPEIVSIIVQEEPEKVEDTGKIDNFPKEPPKKSTNLPNTTTVKRKLQVK